MQTIVNGLRLTSLLKLDNCYLIFIITCLLVEISRSVAVYCSQPVLEPSV